MASTRNQNRVGRTRAPKATPNPPAAPYTSRIIKAGALLADTKTLLSHWDTAASVKANLARVRQENLFGKASRSRVEDILAIFRQRYLSDEGVAKALVVFVKNRLPAASLDRILFFHSARNDRLLHDAVTELLLPLNARGATDVDVLEVQRAVAKWVAQGKTAGKWGDATIRPRDAGPPLRTSGLWRPTGRGQQADRACLSARLRHLPTSPST